LFRSSNAVLLHNRAQKELKVAQPQTEVRSKALEAAVGKIERQYGRGSIMRMGEVAHEQVEVTPSGSLALDVALGVGGIPRGRITEVFGPESSGKTTLALHIIAETQKLGGVAVFVDAEHALDPIYARRLGVKTDELLISQPDYGEQALDIVESLVMSGAVDIVVVDSVAALVPKAEIDGEMGDTHVGLQARLMSQALRKLTAAIHRSNVTVVFINQVRTKIGVMFGNPETTTGGNALKFYSTIRIEVRRIGPLKKGDEQVGNRTRGKIVKNKVAPPFREVEFDILYGEGISKEGEALDMGTELGLVEKSGSWYAYEGEKIGQGRENARLYLREHPEIVQKIESSIFERLHIVRNLGQRAQKQETNS